MFYWKFNPAVPESAPVSIPNMDDVKRAYKTDGWQLDNLLRDGVWKQAGWYFDFRGELKKFWFKTVDGDLLERFAPNRTLLRKSIHHKILGIVNAPA